MIPHSDLCLFGLNRHNHVTRQAPGPGDLGSRSDKPPYPYTRALATDRVPRNACGLIFDSRGNKEAPIAGTAGTLSAVCLVGNVGLAEGLKWASGVGRT